MKKYILCLLVSLSTVVMAQPYPKDYFRNPLGLPIMLAGNFGECRPGHFHSGIDIKTEGKENKPVYAAADGYVSRIKMEPGGFGHGIYISHPNGYTTLYAHLNDFFPELQEFVRRIQYSQKSWEMDTILQATQFPVKKGQQIAWSGNTGGSSAPHLHFEIRDTKTEHPLNPMLFGLEIRDNIAPVLTEVVFYDGGRSIYEQDVSRFKVRKKKDAYVPLADTLFVSGNELLLGIAVNDFMNGSDNTLSVYTAEWFLDDSLQGRLTLDDIGYEETRYLNACADYKIHKQTGIWFNSLFVLPNNKLGKLYSSLQGINGRIKLKANSLNKITVQLKDAAGNTSAVLLPVWPLSAKSAGACTDTWTAGKRNTLETPNVKVSLDNAALYDDICFSYEKMPERNLSFTRWRICDPAIPLHTYADISIRPQSAIPFALTNKIVMVQEDGKARSGKRTSFSNGWYSASFRSFGIYSLAIDTTAPLIRPLAKNGLVLNEKKEIAFLVTDGLTSVKRFSGSVNGHWLCFEQHGSKWFYKVDGYCPKGKNRLELLAEDESGNVRRMNFSFTR